MPSSPVPAAIAAAAAAATTRRSHMSLIRTTARRPILLAVPVIARRSRALHQLLPRHATTTTPTPTTITTTATARRAYHSTDHPPPPGPFGAAESAILAAAYAHVPAHGFSAEALARGARDAGYLDISASIVPDGAFGLIRWHLVTRREALAGRARELFGEEGKGQGQRALSVREKVEALTWERLLGNAEVAGRWQEALAIMAQPSYVPASLKELALLADETWYLAGDVAVDPSWYTKRAALSAVYASAELFMTDDRSAGFEGTRAFLRRRLDEADELGGAVRSLGQWLGFSATATVNVLRSKGVPI